MFPLIAIVPLVGMAGAGLYKTVKGTMDSNTADDTNASASSIVDSARASAQQQREKSNALFEDYGSRKLRAFNGVIEDFLVTFSQLKNVESIQTPELEKLHLGDFSNVSLQGLRHDYQLLKDSGLGLGAGLTGGAAVAFGAYSGTMMLATAGTGTAISALSGVAATNATLAWLGGGTLAAGGGGMALGSMVLGGLVAAPALAIFGYFIGSKGSEALANAETNRERALSLRAEIDKVNEQLEAIDNVTNLANHTFSKVSGLLRRAVKDLRKVIEAHGDDYQTYTIENREAVFRTVKFAQLIKALLDTPILDDTGALVLSTSKRFEEIAETAGINLTSPS